MRQVDFSALSRIKYRNHWTIHILESKTLVCCFTTNCRHKNNNVVTNDISSPMNDGNSKYSIEIQHVF